MSSVRVMVPPTRVVPPDTRPNKPGAWTQVLEARRAILAQR
jgi:hypothetical protein